MIDEKTFFDQSVKNDKVTYENVRKIATCKVDDYTTCFLLDYIYFKNYYKLIVVDLSNQQGLDADPKAIHQINFTASLDRAGNTRTYFILEEVNELFTRNCKSFVNAIPFSATSLIFYQYKMTQYDSLNLKLSNSQLNEVNSAIKNETEVVLRLSSNMVGDDETSFPHKLLLTKRQVGNLRKGFGNYSSTDIKSFQLLQD